MGLWNKTMGKRSRPRALVCGVVLGLVVLALPRVAWAYRTVGERPEFGDSARVRWRGPSISYALRTPMPAGVSVADVRAGVAAAVGLVQAPACVGLDLVDLGSVPTAARAGDGLFTVEVVADWAGRGLTAEVASRVDSGPEAAAISELRFVQDGQGWFIAEADIYLRGDHLLGRADVADEVRRLLVHELLHALGLEHPCAPELGLVCDAQDALSMLAPTRPALGGPEALSADDEAGLCDLYPEGECTGSCPQGAACVDGRCLPQACVAGDDCPSGRCALGRCGFVAPQLGDPCTQNGECASALCSSAGACTRACALGCDAGFRCDQGLCVADGFGYGEGCARAAQCQSGLCLTGAPGGDRCTRACGADDDCPVPDLCAEVEGRAVCAPVVQVSAGCAVSTPGWSAHSLAARPPGARWLSLCLLWLIACVLVRRRRSRRAWPARSPAHRPTTELNR